MKIKYQRFLSGPNIYEPVSGLFVTVALDDKYAGLFGWAPAEKELERHLALLREALPVTQESPLLSSTDYILKSDCPAVALVLAVTESLLNDFCVQPQPGRMIALEKDQVDFFVPCDGTELGVTSLQLGLMALQAKSFSEKMPESQVGDLLRKRYVEVRTMLRGFGLNQSTVELARAAFKRGIYYYRLFKPGQFLQLGQGIHSNRIMETSSDRTSFIGNMLSRDKFLTASLFRSHGLPVPDSWQVVSMEQAKMIVSEKGFPLVVKPRSMAKGKGVFVNIRDETAFMKALKEVAAYNAGIVIERHVEGDDHRLLVVGGRLVAAAKRLPAMVVGDGHSTVRQLVEETNRDPRRGMAFERVLEKIEIDGEARQCLAEEGLTPDSVLPPGQVVRLRGAANISRGGTSVDVTEDIHPDNRKMAEQAARLIGLDVTGIDFLTPDISKSWTDIRCAILEANSTPGLRPHLGANPDHDVAGPIIEHYFPDGHDGRVPTVGITGSLGKTTICHMVADILSAAGKNVALSTTQGAWIGNDRIRRGDVAGGKSAASLLLDPSVEAGVFELSRGGLVKIGMWLDSVEIGAVLNVQDNHVGFDGVDTREELARVKSLVVQNARKMAVLNADDPLCLAMRDQLKAPGLCLVSSGPDNEVLQAHQAAGGLVAYLDCREDRWEAGEIMLYEGELLVGSLSVGDIGSALGGRYRPAVINALFAVPIAHGLGIGFDSISQTVSSFESTRETNPGRMNFVEGLPYQLYITETDGPVSLKELADFVEKTDVPGKKYIVLGAMGNRLDTFILQTAEAVVGFFDHYICSDWDDDLRGRSPGEVSEMLSRSLIDAGVEQDRITTIPKYEQALERLTAMVSEGDLAIVSLGGEAVWSKIEPFLSPGT